MRWPTLAAFVVALAVGGLCLLHGFGFMAGFNTTPLPALSELARTHTPQTTSLGEHGRVMLVVVDGLRADVAADLGLVAPSGMPYAACQLETVMPSFSRPAYVALSTGVPPWASGVQTNDHKGPAALPSIWEGARKAGIPTHLVSDGTDWWVDLFPRAFDQVDIVPKRDFDAFWEAMPPPAPGSLLLLHIVAVDDAGHDFGVHDAYRAEAVRAGKKIQRLLSGLEPRDTLLVTADHGHITRGGHGGPEPEVLAVPLLAFGAGVVASPASERSADGRSEAPWCGSLLDVPVAIAARLGIEPPIDGFGSLLPVIVPSAAGFPALLAAQSVALHDLLGAGPNAFAQGRARLPSLRGLAIAFALWLALCLALAWAVVVGARLRSLVSALVPPVIFGVAYAIMEPTLSLSAVWLENPWTVHVALIAAASALLGCLFVFRRHAPDEALLLMGTGAALPILLALFVHGSCSAGPVLGEPHAAFAIVVADLFAGVAVAVALLVYLFAFARERRLAHAKVWA